MADGHTKKKKAHAKRVVRKSRGPGRQKQSVRHFFSTARLETIRDMSARLSMPANRIEVTIAAALLEDDLFTPLSQLIEVLLRNSSTAEDWRPARISKRTHSRK